MCIAQPSDENASRKALLDRIVAMLTKRGQQGYAVHEDPALYTAGNDPDTDSDADTDGIGEQTDRQPMPGAYADKPRRSG